MTERVDPLLGLLSGQGIVLWQVIISGLGLLFLYRLRGTSWLHGLFGSLLLLLITAVSTPLSTAVSMACWFPWLLLAASLCLKNSKGSGLLYSLFGVLLAVWLYSGGVRATFGLVALVIWILLDERCVSESARGFCLALAGIAMVLALLLVPQPPALDYPSDARLVPLSPLYFYRSIPYLGSGPAFVPSTYESLLDSMRQILMGVALAIFCSVVMVTVTREISKSTWRRTAWCIVGIGVLCSELLVSEPHRLWSGFEVLRRLLPGMSYVPGPSYLILPLVVTSFLPIFSERGKHQSVILAVFCGVAGLGIYSNQALSLAALTAPLSSCVAPGTSLSSRLQLSPSAYLLKHKHYLFPEGNVPIALDKLRDRQFIRLTSSVKIKASVNDQDSARAIDGDLQTAWSTQRPQKADDSIILSLENAPNVSRVVLRLGKLSSDFPRGVLVRVRGPVGERLMVDETKWLGPIQYTNKGFPYFGPEQKVILDFPEPVLSAEIEITLTAGDATYAWSVAEVELYSSPPPSPSGS